MIGRDVEIVNMDPQIWRNILPFVKSGPVAGHPPKNPNVLAILHERGNVLHMYAPEGRAVDPIQRVDDPNALAEKLFHQIPGLDEVQVLEIGSLRDFSSRIQKCDWQNMGFDDFYFSAFELAGQDPAGLCYFPRRVFAWKGFSLPAIRSWLQTLPSPGAFMLGICRDAAPWFSLIIKVVDKKIRLITTMEYLSRFDPGAVRLPSSPADLQTVSQLITKNIAPLSAAVICDYSVMETLLASDHKGDALKQAVQDNKAAAIGLPPAAA